MMSGPVLLYDGTCGLCAWSVRFVLRHDRREVLRFASLDGAFARPVLARHPQLRERDTVVWYEAATPGGHERILTRSAAILQVARYLGGRWRLVALPAAMLPRPLLDLLYRVVARNRRALSGPAACRLPPATGRHRFLP